jgi:hypothetical protein
MRERFFDRHAETLARYSVEVAMLLENRLMHQLHRESSNATGDAAGLRKFAQTSVPLAARKLRSRFTSALHRVRERRY